MSVALVAGLAIWLALGATVQLAAPASRLAPIAAYLGGTHDASSATGQRHGVAVTLRYAATGAGSQVEYATAVDAALPDGCPLSVYLRRRGSHDDALVRDGQLVDVGVGDAAFDRAFLISAAPTEVVRALLDAETRAFITARPGLTLVTRVAGHSRSLQLVLPGWIEDMSEVTATVDACVQLAGRVREIHDAIRRSGPAAGGPYRAVLDGSAAHDAETARAAEVAAVDALHTRGRGPSPRWAFAIFWVAVMAAVAALWLGRE